MNAPTAASARPAPAAAAGAAGHALTLADQSVPLDRGGFAVVQWPDADSLQRDAFAVCLQGEPVVRHVGGALIEDLNLMDNLFLESALDGGAMPLWLWPELQALFARTGTELDTNWTTAMPGEISPRVLLQVRVGRALAADPDVLLIDAHEWDDDALGPDRFTQAFLAQYPWRALVWATHEPGRAHWLRESLQEFAP